jgi:aryl-alcohol dehydrogenase-like predicted oxidoreductase
MAIVSWASLGGGVLTTKEQRQKMADDPDAPKGYGDNPFDIAVSEVIEDLARSKSVTFQDIVSCPCYVTAPGQPLILN